MSDELRIAHNEISKKAVLTTASSEDADYPHENALQGTKTTFWKTDGAVTESWVTCDLGASYSQGVDYLIISGLLHILTNSPGQVDIELRASTDNFSISNVLLDTQTNVLESDLLGSYGEDYLLELSATSASYRYFRAVIKTTNSVVHKIRNLAMGKWFDFGGRSPIFPYGLALDSNAGNKGFESDAGTVFKTSSGRAKRGFGFTWNVVTDAIRKEFLDDIDSYSSDFPVWLVEPEDFPQSVLPNRMFLGWGTYSYDTSDWKNISMVQGNFIEDILG